jgi:hypothetical protein
MKIAFFLTVLQKSSNIMKVHQVRAESLHAGGQKGWWTDMMMQIVVYNFADVPNDDNFG